MQKVKVGLLGLGTVGGGVYRLLKANGEDIAHKAGTVIEVKKILVRDPSRHREVPPELLTTDYREIVEDDEIRVIVEVMGGIEPARSYILEAFHRGKSVVTANKDLLAEYGKELFDAEEEHKADFFFEASVAGGIPIIGALKESLAANRILDVMGIVNGTTNYILTRMEAEGASFEEVLADAQRLGYAEADPAADVDGLDAARKVAILASIAFNTRVTFKDVYAEGIRSIGQADIAYARELGYTIKLLGIAREDGGQIEARVHPALVAADHPLASVQDVFNAIFVRGDAVGETMFYGRGAGAGPTASAVAGDIIEVARDVNKGITGRLGCTCYEHLRVKPISQIETRYYLRLAVKDQPGVLAGIAGVFGNHGVSLANVIQKRTAAAEAELVLVTHKVKEENLRDALAIIAELSTVSGIANVIRVEGSEK